MSSIEENGAYEVIKERLIKQGTDLKERINKLNTLRKETFGSIETEVIGSERIITENNCIPRDMTSVEDLILFGYNVLIGLKSKVEISDVFAVYKFENNKFINQPLDLINDQEFIKDFDELYKYYKNTFFAKFTVTKPFLYMIFQTSNNPEDIKVFKWEIRGNKLNYVDCRSEHEVKFKNKSEFNFVRTTRDDQRNGKYPHISIMDKVFVETCGGDLTIKVEDNTETGKGIYAEPVEDKDQTLDDAEIYYADLEQLIILKMKPYKENDFRYFVFNNKLKTVVRIDAIKDSCILLPNDHGLIFPKGYYLQSGEYKIFDVEADKAIYDERITSLNGEDFQYIFYNTKNGEYLIYSYNIIEQKIDTPILCSGYAHFNNGEMIVIKSEEDPRKNHMIQIWRTPYVDNNVVTDVKGDSELSNIGNKDIVNAMSDCKNICKLIDKKESYRTIYADIVRECERIIDSYFWLDKNIVFNLKEILLTIKESAAFAIGEFEKVMRIKAASKAQVNEVSSECEQLLSNLKYGSYDSIDNYVKALANIRSLRGKIASLKDLRYIDLDFINNLDKDVKEKNEEFSNKCVEFLLTEEGLKPYEDKVNELQGEIETVAKSSEGKELEKKINATSADLELLIEIISNFKIEDPTKTTEIIEKISKLFSLINNGKSRLLSKLSEMTKEEMSTQFFSQIKLLSQSVVNYLDICDTVDKCDEYLNKALVMIQELEGKFAEFDDYIITLSEKREEIYNAFESKKQAILDKLNKKIINQFNSAKRILSGITNRVATFKTFEEINGYLATDIMVEKVRDIISNLNELGDNVKADEIFSTLKKIKEDAISSLKDKQELYVDGENIIKLGKHKFSVNTKAIDLSIVQKDDGLYYHITGTDFTEKVENENINKYNHVFNQSVLSENNEVYRGEYLAYLVFEASKNNDIESLDDLYTKSEEQLSIVIQKFMESRYDEGYTKGVHDVDTAKILKQLITMHKEIDLLIFNNDSRAMARLYWKCIADENTKAILRGRLKELAKVNLYFNSKPNLGSYIPFVFEGITKSIIAKLFNKEYISEASEYLCLEIMKGEEFIISKEAKSIYDGFISNLRDKGVLNNFLESIKSSKNDIEGLYYLVNECVLAYKESADFDLELISNFNDEEVSRILNEVIVMIIDHEDSKERVIYVDSKYKVTGLIGTHSVINNGEYILSFTTFMNKLRYFKERFVNSFIEFQDIKKVLIKKFKEKLHLDDYKPQVLTSFVRNQLIDKVYLPIIGDNLAKQIGDASENKRTDLMGLLLLLSPPGYGKTTLMEYIASRLGINLVKINGPSLGNEVTSLDPAMAPNSGAKEELIKLNIALKMGNNVMIYVDDIQHCNPEFLQKFISLCDGQRKIDGVYNGIGQTFNLRGKKVAVVMAGNPYTESGEKFKIPDMLANRADVYNLGDMLMENEEAFKLSYIENALTSNSVLSRLATSSKADLYGFVDMANGASRESVNLEGNYSLDEINEYISVLQKLFKVRDIVLKVNLEYIHSAAQADEYRNEPAFKLQGSYRNMNKIAEKIVPIMNDEELFHKILASYENDSQTLTTGAEANMLKWKEITGCITEEEKIRYKEIKSIFNQNKLVKGDDMLGQAVMVLGGITEKLGMIKEIFDKW